MGQSSTVLRADISSCSSLPNRYALTYRAKIDSTILCSNVRVGEKAQVQASEIGSGYEVEPDGKSCDGIPTSL